MSTIVRLASSGLLAVSLSACASVTSGTTQTVAVQTTPKSGASCDLRNEKGAWAVPSTPGSTTVSKAHSPLTITCATDDGWQGVANIRSDTDGATFGNVLLGGMIGVAVDMNSGAAYLYPPSVTVVLVGPDGATLPEDGSPPVIPLPRSAAERLEELKILKDRGEISGEEYSSRRQEIFREI